MPKPKKKPGPREERLVIREDPEKALQKLLAPKPSKKKTPAKADQEQPCRD